MSLPPSAHSQHGDRSTAKQHSQRNNSQSSLMICNVNDYQRAARESLPKALYEYLASGSNDEQTLHENQAAFYGWFLRPRVLRPVGTISTSVPSSNNLLFQSSKSSPWAFPLFVSPAGVHALCDPIHGECATARACQTARIPFGVSQHATRTLEEIMAAATAVASSCSSSPSMSMLWYQAYLLKDRTVTARLIQRAISAGYEAIVLTVDSVRFGFREADARNAFNALPAPHRLVHYDDDKTDIHDNHVNSTGTNIYSDRNNDTSSSSLRDTYNSQRHAAWDQNSELLFETNVSWEDVRWCKELLLRCATTSTKNHVVPRLIVKGIMTAEDAALAVQAGADAVMVSNHGGRQLDGCLGTIDVLPEVVTAVPSHIPVLLDGGVRRGSDIFKALALGATAVGIGKPVFFALATGGQEAVENLLDLLHQELQACMALCGCATVAKIGRDHVTRRPSFGSSYVRAKL